MGGGGGILSYVGPIVPVTTSMFQKGGGGDPSYVGLIVPVTTGMYRRGGGIQVVLC